MNKTKEELLSKIKTDSVRIAVVGLGYVGLPLAVTFASKGLSVVGVDKDCRKIDSLRDRINYVHDVEDEDLRRVLDNGTLEVTEDSSQFSTCDAIILCVPTPLDRYKKPDMSYIESACRNIASHMRPGTFVCLESTTFPTTTEHLLRPIIEDGTGYALEKEYWLAYSPERVDPGNKNYKTGNTPKVIGGAGPDSLEIGIALYSKAISAVYPVSSPRVAEMVKILENTYRLINISLINELALLAGKMDINIWEVIEAAKTKPYGFQAFYPGPGVGGHCIPLDPFYLEHIAKIYNFDLTMIHTAGQINNFMPYRMMNKISYALNRKKKPLNGSSILFLGVAYKPDISDERESPALSIIDEVVKKGAVVSYHDPHIAQIKTAKGHSFSSTCLTEAAIAGSDCVVITTNHSCFDVDWIAETAPLLVDLQNAVHTVHIETDNIFKL